MISSSEIANMMIDLYETIGIIYNPSKNDVDSFAAILDYNKDEFVTPDDMEQTCYSILYGKPDFLIHKTDLLN